MKFRNAYSLPKDNALSYGNLESVHGYFFDENGVRQFGVIGERDQQADIDRYKDSCENTILKAYLLQNIGNYEEKGLFGVRPDIISDVNDIALNLEKANELYNSLPDVIKEKYKSMIEVVNGFNEEDLQLLKADNLDNSSNNEVAKDE